MTKKRGTKDSQETKRLLVVSYLKSKKGTHQEAADLFQLSKSAVDKIWTRYNQKGKRGLISKSEVYKKVKK